MGLNVHRNIAMVRASSYPFIKSLFDLISKGLGRLVEPGYGYVSGDPSGAKLYDSGGYFCYSIVHNAVINMKTCLKGKKEWHLYDASLDPPLTQG